MKLYFLQVRQNNEQYIMHFIELIFSGSQTFSPCIEDLHATISTTLLSQWLALLAYLISKHLKSVFFRNQVV
jgi:hypothetical protein